LSEKTDIYSLGSTIFFILTGMYPYFYDVGDYYEVESWTSIVKRLLRKCKKPTLSERFTSASGASPDAIELQLEQIMQWCHSCEQADRPTALELVHNLTLTQVWNEHQRAAVVKS
jgi:serine/threonine protein kinase